MKSLLLCTLLSCLVGCAAPPPPIAPTRLPGGMALEIDAGSGRPLTFETADLEAALDRHWTPASFAVLKRSALPGEQAHVQLLKLAWPEIMSAVGCRSMTLIDIAPVNAAGVLERWTVDACGQRKVVDIVRPG